MISKNNIILFFILFSFLPFCNRFSIFAQPQEEWFTKKDTHFIIYYNPGVDNAYVSRLLTKAEKYYSDITDVFGFRRFNFWTWDKRCKIYLYSSYEDYYNNTKQPEWSKASVQIGARTIHTPSLEQFFIDTILPHEMGHLIFREFVGSSVVQPLWLDEGIATFVEGNEGRRLAYAKKIVKTSSFIPLGELTEINLSNISDPDVFYAEAASLIEFMLHQYGREKFVEYCRRLRDQENWYQALQDVYGFSDLAQMNAQWVEWLGS